MDREANTEYRSFETEVAVRPGDIDLHGHVHSPEYLSYFLAARFDQMKRCYGASMLVTGPC